MTHTLRIRTRIPSSRKVEITLPAEVPLGAADLVVTVTSKRGDGHSAERPGLDAPIIRTFSDLISSEFAGMWATRLDLPATDEEFREWRRQLWERDTA
jgi:hypothetical protein